MRKKSDKSSCGVDSWNLADLGSFYVSNKSHFVAHAMRRLADSVRAEEVVHEAILKVMLAAPELSSVDHARAYVHRTIDNLCMDIFRLEGRRPSLIVLDDATAEIEKSSFDSDVDLSDALSRAEDAAIVRNAISLLSPAERAALVMWEVDERSANEIALELGIKETSVRHTVSRARASLRRILATLIIDEKRGLTGLDLLSSSYARSREVAKKSSKVALSLVLVFFAFAGFNSLNSSISEMSPVNDKLKEVVPNEVVQNEKPISAMEVEKKVDTISDPTSPVSETKATKKESAMFSLKFPGLGKNGIPTGFTVADSTGAVGPAYFRERAVSSPISYISSAQVIKTESVAANIFIAQTISWQGREFEYSPVVSFGRAGEWAPLLVSVQKSETRRLEDGNYMVTVQIAVESEVDSPIRVQAKAKGRDLDNAPDRVITRLVLDSSKTIVLAQAVYVIESKAGA